MVTSNLTYPDETQLSNWNPQHPKITDKHWYTKNGIPLSVWNSFVSASYGVKTTKKHKINSELSKTEH